MKALPSGLCALLLACSCAFDGGGEPPRPFFTWEELPPMPEPLGLGGAFAGVVRGELTVAGGTNFPTPLFEGGRKVWADKLFVFSPKQKEWIGLGSLERSLAYGASVTWRGELYCIGGCDATACYPATLPVSPPHAQPTAADFLLPPLPKPCAMMGAALIGDTVYVAGGQESPTATAALKTLWALDLRERRRWVELEPWPGPARILPVVAAQSNGHETQVYVISGAELTPARDGKPVRRYLADSYAYSPKSKTWRRIADAPRPVVAAPAIAYGKYQILVFGGDDGANAARVFELKNAHPGFSRDVLAYDARTDAWSKVGTMPVGLATTTAVAWRGGIVIPSGEDRPGHRSPKVLFALPREPDGH